MRNTLITTLLIGGGILLTLLLTSTDDPIDDTQQSFEQHPPIAVNFWVQKINNPGDESNIIFRVEYTSDAALPEQIKLYQM